MGKCNQCEYERHFCQCGNETGHYGNQPAAFCDDCRLGRINNFGSVGDEPEKKDLL
jgi:hypothetical protein